MALKLTVGTVTDRGLNPKRQANEDRLLSLPKAQLFLVADGVGGRRGGQVASQTVTDVFKNAFEDGQRAGNDMLTALKQTVGICNRSIFESSSEVAELRGMATTIALVAAVNDTRAIIGHVGDSRVYRFDGKDLIGETQDHSEVSDAIRAGLITPAQAATHPRRNVINRAIGAEQEVEADFKIVSLNDRTSFLLCSDGVTRHLNDGELTELLRSGAHPQKLCDRIKELCFERGAEDNLTAIVVDFGERKYNELPAAHPSAKGQAASTNGRPGRIEVEVAAPEPRPMTGRLTMLEMPEPEPRMPSLGPTSNTGPLSNSVPSMFAPDRKANAKDSWPPSSPSGGKDEPKAASSISFWGRKEGGGNAPEPLSTQENVAARTRQANRGLTWRDYVVVCFYLALLATAFGFGRYYDEVVSWVAGEPVAKPQRNAAGRAVQADADLLAARQLFNAGRFDAAQKQFESLVGKTPTNAQYQLGLGAALAEAGKPAEALKPLQEAVRLDPNLSEGYVRLALAYSVLKDQKNADDALRRAAALGQ